MMLRRIAVCALLSCPAVAFGACFDVAGARYGVSSQLLCAVAKCESNMNATAINRTHKARTGTIDIGLMQINSSHLTWLEKYGIDEQRLLDPCTSVHVGAYLLAANLQRYGDTWEAVGAYNAACSKLKGEKCTEARTRYAWCVHRRFPSCAGTAERGIRQPSVTAAAGGTH